MARPQGRLQCRIVQPSALHLEPGDRHLRAAAHGQPGAASCTLSHAATPLIAQLDAAYEPQSEFAASTTWWVSPPQARGLNGLLDAAPRARVEYRVRLLCGGEGNRTVLYESASGVPGSIAANWAFAVARNESVRMCTWDRPGYGLSDNAPSASLEHTVQALELALKQAGELARAKNGDGFVLVSQGFGSLVSRVFAARHAKDVSAMLFIDPQTASTYFDRLAPGFGRHFRYFIGEVIPDVLSPLGIRRWTYIITSSTKRTAAARRLSPAREGLEPGILRATLQEAVRLASPCARLIE